MDILQPSLQFSTVAALIFVVAVLYSSVGHGGASGYLAILSLFALAPTSMSTTALMLNLLVAGTALVAYWRAGYLSWQFTLPFCVTSVPAAFLGGFLRVSPHLYAILLAGVLVLAAIRMMLSLEARGKVSPLNAPSLAVALPIGGGVGFLSGVVGVGGGIFLSPLLILLRWADVKRTAATSAAFILINSASGLLGRYAGGALELGPFLPLVPAAFLGGLLGSRLGATRFSGQTLRRLLGIVLLVASVKLALTLV